jgi:hypothetical protein
MRRVITRGPPADGGYPFDGDLHQMTDDGCPLVPDPARWADDDWRDNLGEWDTFGGDVRADSSAPAPVGAGIVQRVPLPPLAGAS